jgi:flagellar hook-basal body complex protein FliE
MAEIGISSYTQLPKLVGRESLVDEAPAQINPGAAGKAESGASFLETLKGALGEVNEMQLNADKAAQDFSTGQAKNLHDVMIAMEKAEVALKTVTAVRNKMIEAYQEIMRMPV